MRLWACLCSWLEKSLEALRQGAEGQAVRRASELRHAVPLSSSGTPAAEAGATEEPPRWALSVEPQRSKNNLQKNAMLAALHACNRYSQ